MSKTKVLALLENVQNASRENRNSVANIVFDDKNLQKHLVETCFEVDNKLSIKAAWILEWICTHKDLNIILPHLTYFTNQLQNLKFDSAIRPCAKICEHLAFQFNQKEPNSIQNTLHNNISIPL